MEAPVSRSPFWRQVLIAESGGRGRRRWLLVVLLLLVAGVAAAVPPGHAARARSSHSLHFGAFALTVPKGFYQLETHESSTSHVLHSIAIADDSLAARAASYAHGSVPANGVVLMVENFGSTAPGSLPRLPLDLHKLRRVPDAPWGGGHGNQWSAFLTGGGKAWSVTVFEGSNASAVDRAAIEHLLSSIRRAR